MSIEKVREALEFIARTDISSQPLDFKWLSYWRNSRKQVAQEAFERLNQMKPWPSRDEFEAAFWAWESEQDPTTITSQPSLIHVWAYDYLTQCVAPDVK